MKKSTSEHFRLITPVNTVINTFMLGIIGFFMAQQYYRVDRIEEKVNKLYYSKYTEVARTCTIEYPNG